MTFSRHITGTIAALAIVLSGMIATTAPARAQSSEDLFRFLLGAATIAIIISAFDERNAHFPRPYTGRILPDQCLETYRAQGRDIRAYNARCLELAGLRNLPLSCRHNVQTNRGTRTVYNSSCLYRAGYSPEGISDRPDWEVRRVLPNECAITYRSSGRLVAGYLAPCLRRLGLTTLPNNCIEREWTNTGWRNVANADCMYRAGFRAEQRSSPALPILPAECGLTYRYLEERLGGYYGDCLTRRGISNLPRNCSLTATLEGQRMTIYNARCLVTAGYREERSR